MFYFSRSSFFWEICTTSYFAAAKHVNLQKSENMPLQPLLFACLKLVPRRIRCAVKFLVDFTEENSRLSQIKP